MTPIEWATLPLKKYSDFSGRSRRKEFWFFVLLSVVVGVVANTIDGIIGLTGLVGGLYGPLGFVTGLVLLLPGIAVGIRRLHDTNRSGWWMLLGIVPNLLSTLLFITGSYAMTGMIGFIAMLGGIALLVLMVLEGTKGPNQYGPDPLEGERASEPGTV